METFRWSPPVNFKPNHHIEWKYFLKYFSLFLFFQKRSAKPTTTKTVTWWEYTGKRTAYFHEFQTKMFYQHLNDQLSRSVWVTWPAVWLRGHESSPCLRFSPFLDECFRQSPFNSRSKSSSPAEASSSTRVLFHGEPLLTHTHTNIQELWYMLRHRDNNDAPVVFFWVG